MSESGGDDSGEESDDARSCWTAKAVAIVRTRVR